MTTYDQALELMVAVPMILDAIVGATSPEILERPPAAESWSARQVLAHLAHVETRVIGARIRQMLREDDPVLGPVPPGETAADPDTLLAAWRAARTENLALLRDLTPAQLARTGRHPRYGAITVREHVVEWAYHDLDHLRQILGALQADLYPHIGAFQALYPKPT